MPSATQDPVLPTPPLLLGVIGRPHGVRGHVHVHSYTADPQDLASYGPLHDRAGRRYALRWLGDGIAELTELTDGAPRITSREAAARLTNVQLFIDRAALPAPDDEEFYLSDLIGLAAVTPDGAPIGRVAVLHDYGAGASLEILGQGAPLLVPFTRACVPEIDLAARRLTIRPPVETIGEPAP